MAKQGLVVAKKVKNGVLYTNGCIMLLHVRLSFPHFGTPNEQENEKTGAIQKNYGTVCMLPKESHLPLKNLIRDQIQALLTEEGAKVPKENWFLKDGTKQAEGDEKKEVYAGHWTVNCSERRRPEIRDRHGRLLNGEKTDEELDEMFYGGCWANVLIRPWYFNGVAKKAKEKYPKRISANCIGVQFWKDDERFGQGAIDTDGAWEESDEDDDTDAMDDDDEI